ncbi:MAG: hypothetical protein ABI944_05630 [Chthoniobacterales bacterium]
MAKKSGQTRPLHELRQEIAHSRDRLSRDLAGLRYEFDFPLKFRKSFQQKTGIWVAGAAVLGVVLSVFPARTKKVSVKHSIKDKGEKQKEGLLGAGLAMGVFKLAATLLRPMVSNYVSQRMTGISRGGGRSGRA